MPNQSNAQLLKVAIYIRVSSDEQARNGDSIRDQQETCTEYINKHENMILQDIYVDDGVSGQKLERDDFTRLMANVALCEINLIIFTKLDRWFRSLRHYLNTQSTLEKHEVVWTAINQPYFDTSTPYGRAFVAQSMTWAELEAQNGGMRVRDVFKNKVEHGEVITGKVPRGYKIENKHLVFSEEAPIILDVFKEMKRSQSVSATLRYMQDTYGIVMTLTNLKESILMNKKYTGRYRNNENFCPRLIPEELFQDVQDIFKKRQNIKSGQRYPYIFSGLLVCDECNKNMSGCHINVKSVKNSGKIFRYKYPAYECRQYRLKHCLNGGEIRELKIETYLLDTIRSTMLDYIARYEAEAEPQINNRPKKASIEKKLERLKTLYLNELITLDEYKMDRASLQKALTDIPDVIESEKSTAFLKEILESDFESIYITLSNEEKRLFWRSIIKEIRVLKSINRNREYKVIFL